jgi:hypothetical protein
MISHVDLPAASQKQNSLSPDTLIDRIHGALSFDAKRAEKTGKIPPSEQ